jgi:hypothetical protein
VRTALARLPWVDKGSVEADTDTQRVTFAVTDRRQFNEKQLRGVLREVDFPDVEVLKRP